MMLNLLRLAGVLMITLSLGALSAELPAAIDAQCVKRCNCSGSPCTSIVKCQDGEGTWMFCCRWCQF